MTKQLVSELFFIVVSFHNNVKFWRVEEWTEIVLQIVLWEIQLHVEK